MPDINLLPWRDTLKQERQIRFGITTGLALAVTAIVFLGVHLYFAGLIDYQTMRNDYLRAEIKEVEKQIKEIETLQEKKERLIARMQAIQELETTRSQIVRLFDELVIRLPDGVYFKVMEQEKDKVTLEGVAQSDARVSTLMRSLDESEWLSNPTIEYIRTTSLDGADQDSKRTASEFKLSLKQTAPKKEDEATEEAGEGGDGFEEDF